jgi:hypothetical protein
MMWLRLIANWRDASRGGFAFSPTASDQLRRAKEFEAEISFAAKAASESSGRGCIKIAVSSSPRPYMSS